MKPSAENLSELRVLPSVDRVLREIGQTNLPRPMVLDIVRRELSKIRSSRDVQRLSHEDVLRQVRAAIDATQRSRIRSVINGTGVIIHTNFGRSPLSVRAIEEMLEVARGYSNLEFDLANGERGGRAAYLERALAILCESEAATVINNCAAALVLILRHFVREAKKEVLISRGELVQIGGGFRVPEILEASGAVLREIGTTNQTSVEDYERGIDPERTAMILRVHRSNFFMDGFVDSPSRGELAALTRRQGLPLVEDLGSGAIFDTSTLGGDEREPTPAQAIAGGADLVTFSGDKLLGGPQAGIVAGSREHVEALKRDPFFRALRCDKLVLTALQATVETLLTGESEEIPIRRMMQMATDELRQRAERILSAVNGLNLTVTAAQCESQVGGGSLPRTKIPSICIEIHSHDVAELAEKLRLSKPPIVGRISGGLFQLDLRTIFPHQDEQIIAALRSIG